jgi:SNF2 family DNA or RNA helicase
VKRVIVSRPNKALIVPRDGRTIMFFPNAHRLTDLDTDSLVVPHDIHATVCLRQMGYRVPNPMLCYYDWRGGKPFAVQKATCDGMTTNQRFYVLNAMGTGKTKAALWAWDYLASQGIAGKLLVVATLSTLNFVWAAEAFATLPHRKVAVLHGSRKKRLELLNSDADIFVINHDGLRTIQAELTLRTDIDTLCLDELAVYRNNSDRSKAMRKFAERFKIIWGLTGAPMPQAPTDVWAQAKIITPNTVPKYFKQAEELLMNRRNTYMLVPKDNAIETAFKMLQPSVRYSLDAVVELPEVVHSTIDVPLTTQQAKVYKTLADAFVADVGAGKIVAVNSAVAMGKLLQVSGGWVYAGEAGAIPLDSKPRQDVLVDLINQNERKVIVMVPFTHALDGVSEVLTAAKIDHCKVDGRVGQGDRSNFFNLFQNTDKYKVLLAHPTCLAHGLTLTAADTIIWYMPITSLDIYDQANARITRVGQSHKQKIIHLQSTSVEKKIYRLLRTKAITQTALLSMLAEATGDAPT